MTRKTVSQPDLLYETFTECSWFVFMFVCLFFGGRHMTLLNVSISLTFHSHFINQLFFYCIRISIFIVNQHVKHQKVHLRSDFKSTDFKIIFDL